MSVDSGYRFFWDLGTSLLSVTAPTPAGSDRFRAVVVRSPSAARGEPSDQIGEIELSFDSDQLVSAAGNEADINGKAGTEAVTSDVSAWRSSVTPWPRHAAALSMALRLGNVDRVLVDIIEIHLAAGTGREPQFITVAQVTLSKAHSMQSIAGAKLRKEAHFGASRQKLDGLWVTSFSPSLSHAGHQSTSVSLPRIAGPGARPELARLARLQLAGGDLVGPPSVSQIASREGDCLAWVPEVGGELGPAEIRQLDEEEIIGLEATVEVLEANRRSASYPVIHVRVPRTIAKVDFLARSARLVHWRRQEDYVWRRLEASQGVRTGDTLVDAIQEVEIEVPKHSSGRLPGTGLYVQELITEEPAIEGDDVVFHFTNKAAQHGDVIGLVFVSPDTMLDVTMPVERDGRIALEAVPLARGAHPLWVFRGDAVVPVDQEALLLSSPHLKGHVEAICERVREEIRIVEGATPDLTEAYRLAIADHPGLRLPGLRALLASEEAGRLPIYIMDVYRACLAEAEKVEIVGAAEAISMLDRRMLSAAIQPVTYANQPAFCSTLLHEPAARREILGSQLWATESGDETVPYILAMAGRPPELCSWVADLSAISQLGIWILFASGYHDLVRWMHEMRLAPDASLFSELAPVMVGDSTRRVDVFERLRSARDLVDNPARLDLLKRAAAQGGNSRLAHTVTTLAAAASSAVANAANPVSYAEMLEVLELNRRTAA